LTKFLITGGAGFVGSHLTQALLNRNDEVVVLDNFSTGQQKNLTGIKAQVISGSIFDEKLVEDLVSKSDHVLHLAAALGVFNIVNKPLESLKTNLQGAEIVLNAAAKFKKPILVTSTSEIYGKNDKVPLSEEDDRLLGSPLKSRWSYSEAKAIDESMAYFYFQEQGLPVRLVRLFNTVGPRQVGHYGMVVPRFVNAALKNENISVYGDGNQVRCFCHVTDAVAALLKVIDSKEAIGQVFNIGNNQQITIMELAKKVIEVTGSKSKIELVPYEKAYGPGFEDMQRRVPDISKIRKMLGWEPKIALEQIIKDIAAYNSAGTLN
jgi:UDP-glucose 4-epimerase